MNINQNDLMKQLKMLNEAKRAGVNPLIELFNSMPDIPEPEIQDSYTSDMAEQDRSRLADERSKAGLWEGGANLLQAATEYSPEALAGMHVYGGYTPKQENLVDRIKQSNRERLSGVQSDISARVKSLATRDKEVNNSNMKKFKEQVKASIAKTKALSNQFGKAGDQTTSLINTDTKEKGQNFRQRLKAQNAKEIAKMNRDGRWDIANLDSRTKLRVKELGNQNNLDVMNLDYSLKTNRDKLLFLLDRSKMVLGNDLKKDYNDYSTGNIMKVDNNRSENKKNEMYLGSGLNMNEATHDQTLRGLNNDQLFSQEQLKMGLQNKYNASTLAQKHNYNLELLKEKQIGDVELANLKGTLTKLNGSKTASSQDKNAAGNRLMSHADKTKDHHVVISAVGDLENYIGTDIESFNLANSGYLTTGWDGRITVTERGQGFMQKFQGIINNKLKALAGSAVTGNELDRVYAAFGLGTNSSSAGQGGFTGSIGDLMTKVNRMLTDTSIDGRRKLENIKEGLRTLKFEASQAVEKHALAASVANGYTGVDLMGGYYKGLADTYRKSNPYLAKTFDVIGKRASTIYNRQLEVPAAGQDLPPTGDNTNTGIKPAGTYKSKRKGK